MAATEKTNAMRLLDRAHIPYQVHVYEHREGQAVDGAQVARLLGQAPETVYKTLVTRAGREYYVFDLPVERELDLKKAARAVGEKSVEMIHVDEINKVTGYIRGGCSPLGMKKQYRTVFHRDVETLKTVVFSGGKIGLQIEAEPGPVLKLIGAITADLTAER
ncbi:MAG: Cys-tRNA(Pro) deacylase [Oscillospiraceae bacterium]|nr:Cys-tRNA(Pro) deacylase [Oscillospiraceae bacterium]